MSPDGAHTSEDGARYYADPVVQRRVREYCGAADGDSSCSFVSQLTPGFCATWATAPRFRAEQLSQLFAAGWDISRSLGDSGSLIVHFEVDVSDPDAPQESLLRPEQSFFDMEPVYQAVRAELTRLDLPLLDVMTGRGYHFAGRVPLTAPVTRQVAALAPGDAAEDEQRHIGLGMVLEHLAHNVIRTAEHTVPVVLNGVEVGRGGPGREAVSIDLSGYGDPEGQRQMRAAFSTYQSHLVRPDIFGARAARDVPVLVAIPRRGRSLMWMLEYARTPAHAIALAPTEDTRIPDVTRGLARLLKEYHGSRLAAFHRAFYGAAMHDAAQWPDTYDKLGARDVVPCLIHALQHPNDALLKPTVLQHLTRYLMAAGWSPRDVAGLVWSKYARDYGWGDRWRRLNARRRAEFDIRVFAGALVTGLDRAIDFNCVSNQEKRLCAFNGCTHDLREDCRRLQDRVAA
jgi:hypothetical protein